MYKTHDTQQYMAVTLKAALEADHDGLLSNPTKGTTALAGVAQLCWNFRTLRISPQV